jgi:hypothetical protein
MKFKFRFDKKFNETVITENRLSLVSRNDLNVIVEGSFYDAIQLKNYPFVKELAECR